MVFKKFFRRDYVRYGIIFTSLLLTGTMSYRLLHAQLAKPMKFIALLEKAEGAEMSAFAPYVEPEAEQVWKQFISRIRFWNYTL